MYIDAILGYIAISIRVDQSECSKLSWSLV